MSFTGDKVNFIHCPYGISFQVHSRCPLHIGFGSNSIAFVVREIEYLCTNHIGLRSAAIYVIRRYHTRNKHIIRQIEPSLGCGILKLSVTASHYNDVIMGTIASQITNLTIVNSCVYSDADQRKYQSSYSLAFVRGIRGPVNSPHKWPVTRKIFPFDDVIMND